MHGPGVADASLVVWGGFLPHATGLCRAQWSLGTRHADILNSLRSTGYGRSRSSLHMSKQRCMDTAVTKKERGRPGHQHSLGSTAAAGVPGRAWHGGAADYF